MIRVLSIVSLVLACASLACASLACGCEQAQPSAEADRARLNELIELNEGGENNGWPHLVAAVKARDIAHARARERFGQDTYIDRLGWSWYGEAPGQDTTIDYFLIDAADEAGAFDRLDQLVASDGAWVLWAPGDSEFSLGVRPGSDASGVRSLSRLCLWRMRREAVAGRGDEVVRSARHMEAIARAQRSALTPSDVLYGLGTTVSLIESIRMLAMEDELDEQTLVALDGMLVSLEAWPKLEPMLEAWIIDARWAAAEMAVQGADMAGEELPRGPMRRAQREWVERAETEAELMRARWDKPLKPEAGLELVGMHLGSRAGIEARRRAARLTIALSRFKRATGQYPRELAMLTPDLIEEVPSDPSNGMPFVYERSGDSYLLYSLGPDGVDDGPNFDYAHRVFDADPARHAGRDYLLSEPRADVSE